MEQSICEEHAFSFGLVTLNLLVSYPSRSIKQELEKIGEVWLKLPM